MGDEESEIVQFILRQFPERPSNPHALVVGRGFRDWGAMGVGVQRRDDHMVLAAVACLGSCSSHKNTGLAVVACHGSSSSSSNSSNGLAAVVFISINVASMSFLPPDRRNSSNR